MPPADSTWNPLKGAEISEEQWMELLEERVALIFPLFDDFAMPRLGSVLRFHRMPHWPSEPLRKWQLPFTPRGHSFSTSGLFCYNPVEEDGQSVWWGVTNKFRWVEIRVQYELDNDPSPNSQQRVPQKVVVVSRTYDYTVERYGPEAVAKMLGARMDELKRRYAPLARAIEICATQDELIRRTGQHPFG